jgi:hypothetical protein
MHLEKTTRRYKMLRICLLITAFLFISLQVSNAQFRMSTQDRVKRLQERLNLSKEQTIKVEAILKKAEDKRNALPEDLTDRREKFRGIMDEANKEIEKILTKDQKVEFTKMLEERRNMMPGNRPQETK